jgi:hypothetical protein
LSPIIAKWIGNYGKLKLFFLDSIFKLVLRDSLTNC